MVFTDKNGTRCVALNQTPTSIMAEPDWPSRISSPSSHSCFNRDRDGKANCTPGWFRNGTLRNETLRCGNSSGLALRSSGPTTVTRCPRVRNSRYKNCEANDEPFANG